MLAPSIVKKNQSEALLLSDAVSQVGGFVKGVGEVVYETGEGLLSLGVSTAKTVYDTSNLERMVDGTEWVAESITGKDLKRPEWMPDSDRGFKRLQKGADIIKTIANDPSLVVDAIVDPIKKDWNEGRYGEAIGRGTAEAASFFLATKGVDKVAKGSRATKIPDEASIGITQEKKALDVNQISQKKQTIEEKNANIKIAENVGVNRDYLNALKDSGFVKSDLNKRYTDYADRGIVKYINDFAKNNPYGITSAEAHAIYGYTTQLFYKKLNTAMGKGTTHKGGELIFLLESGLSKLPNANKTQYMGMDARRSSPLKDKEVGDVISFKPFQSAGNSPTEPFWEKAYIQATIVNSQAKDISDLALFVQHADKLKPPFPKTNQESLFSTNSTFKILELNRNSVILQQVN